MCNTTGVCLILAHTTSSRREWAHTHTLDDMLQQWMAIHVSHMAAAHASAESSSLYRLFTVAGGRPFPWSCSNHARHLHGGCPTPYQVTSRDLAEVTHGPTMVLASTGTCAFTDAVPPCNALAVTTFIKPVLVRPRIEPAICQL